MESDSDLGTLLRMRLAEDLSREQFLSVLASLPDEDLNRLRELIQFVTMQENETSQAPDVELRRRKLTEQLARSLPTVVPPPE